MRRYNLILMIFLLLCSCATPHGKPTSMVQQHGKLAPRGWWYARFKIQWPADTKPQWYLDAAIAREVVQPVLEAYGSQITLWRFHRRAARDNTGHQFSFIFYSGKQSANLIYSGIRKNRFLQLLLSDGKVIKVLYDDTGLLKKPNIQDTSDPHWSMEIQRSWPYFIMGASQMWLRMLDQLWDEYEKDHPSSTFEEQLESYKKVNDSLTYLWEDQCGHALLHHLYALFGYAPVKVRQADILMRF